MSTLVDPRDREAIVHLLAPLARRHRARLCLFGSRARGDARRASDIDIALVGAQPIPLDELALAREALEDSCIRQGTYGQCVDCGVDIPTARLHANPTALRCIDCQSRYERAHPMEAPSL